MISVNVPGSSGAWSRKDSLIALFLFAGTFLSRIPFRTTLLYAWDSVLYTRAIETFNITIEQPHPPGHIYYVALIRAVDLFTGDANSAMIWMSIFFASAAVVALYFLGFRLFGRAAGLLAALLLATGLTFWSYSEVAYPYTLLCFLSIGVAMAIYPLWEGRTAWALPAALLLGVASGFRQDLLFFMLPLLVIGLRGKGLWRAAGAAAVLVAMTAAWYVPSALLSGGFGPYQEASSRQSAELLDNYSVFGRGFEALAANLKTLGRFMLLGLSSTLPLAALMLLGLAAPRMRPVLRDRRLWFLAVWMLPSVFFYIFVHVGEYGYVLSFLPALLLACAWFLERLVNLAGEKARRSPQTISAIFLAVAAVLIGANLVLFLGFATPLSASRLKARDDILSCRIDAVKENFDPASTLIVSVYDYQQAAYYLPEFSHWHFDPAVEKRPRMLLPPGISDVVIFEEYLKPSDDSAAYYLNICRDQRLEYIDPQSRVEIFVDWERRVVSFNGGM